MLSLLPFLMNKPARELVAGQVAQKLGLAPPKPRPWTWYLIGAGAALALIVVSRR